MTIKTSARRARLLGHRGRARSINRRSRIIEVQRRSSAARSTIQVLDELLTESRDLAHEWARKAGQENARAIFAETTTDHVIAMFVLPWWKRRAADFVKRRRNQYKSVVSHVWDDDEPTDEISA